jgi:phosphoglycerate dehydrogenase-like enzyme
MDLLIVEPLEAEVMQWLEQRHAVRYAPELASDPRAFRNALHNVRGLIIPPSVALDAAALHQAPALRVVGRVSAGAENIDLEACGRAGVDVVRSLTGTALAEAEFMVGALLSMLRRVPVVTSDGMLVGRELGAATVGLIGMAPAARSMVQLLSGFGSRIVGYDPSLHASDSIWARWRVEPLSLQELVEQSDALCVQLTYFNRYRGLIGNRVLPSCKPNQVLVCISPSGIFDETALADVLEAGRMSAAWFDSLEPGALAPGRPLHGIENLQVTPRVASTTQESRSRSAWAVAKRIDELLRGPGLKAQLRAAASDDFSPRAPGEPPDFGDDPALP